MEGLDKFLTAEPDNGYHKWCDTVWEFVSKSDAPAAPTTEEVTEFWDKFFEPLTLKLSTIGTLPNGGCSPDFAAEVIIRRWGLLKRELSFLMPSLKS